MNYKMAMLVTLLFGFSCTALGQSFVGTFVTVNGEVKILKSAKPGAKGPFARYEGEKFSYSKAKVGKKIRGNQVVQTGPGGKAKIVFGNGDHFTVGPGTSMVMPAPTGAKTAKNKTSLKLFYGKMRSMISKKGPRRNLDVKTPSAVAGVRGTDFFVNHATGETKLTVIRGEVEVKKVAKNKAPSKPIKVKTGFTAKVETAQKKKPAKGKKIDIEPEKKDKVELVQATKEDFLEVQVASTVKAVDLDIDDVADSVKKEIKELQEKSVAATLTDIKEEDPKLFEEIQKKKGLNEDVTQINTVVVSKLFKKAPKAKKKLKPTQKEIDALGEDIYEKYFNFEE